MVRAHEAGIRRQKLELLLPQAGVTSAQGSWPGGIRQQAQVAVPSMIEPLLRQLKQQEALQVHLLRTCSQTWPRVLRYDFWSCACLLKCVKNSMFDVVGLSGICLGVKACTTRSVC